MKKYIIYYRWKNTSAEDTGCKHHFDEYDTLQEAAANYQKMSWREDVLDLVLLKNIAIKTEYSEIESVV